MKAVIAMNIDNCIECPYHERHMMLTADSFEHEIGIYCSIAESGVETWASYTYDGEIKHRLVASDEWSPDAYASVPDWCPLIMGQYQEILSTLYPYGIDDIYSQQISSILNSLRDNTFDEFTYYTKLYPTRRDEYLATMAAASFCHEENFEEITAPLSNESDRQIIKDATMQSYGGDGEGLIEKFNTIKATAKNNGAKAILPIELSVPMTILLIDRTMEGITIPAKFCTLSFVGQNSFKVYSPVRVAELCYYIDRNLTKCDNILRLDILQGMQDIIQRFFGVESFKVFINDEQVLNENS